jgi:hypothetical protein
MLLLEKSESFVGEGDTSGDNDAVSKASGTIAKHRSRVDNSKVNATGKRCANECVTYV